MRTACRSAPTPSFAMGSRPASWTSSCARSRTRRWRWPPPCGAVSSHHARSAAPPMERAGTPASAGQGTDRMQFTPEQTVAIERRRGELLLDAGAGSGKTSVLVERFARAVHEDGIDVGQILTITFTEKAAAELRERIRLRLREAGDDEAARATEGAWISTIHSFCARLLRTHALGAGLDPEFVVLDEREAAPLRRAAFDAALGVCAQTDAGSELISAYGPAALRATIGATFAELRARGMLDPALPLAPPAPDPLDLRSASLLLMDLALAVQRELGEISDPGRRVLDAIDLLEGAPAVLEPGRPW